MNTVLKTLQYDLVCRSEVFGRLEGAVSRRSADMLLGCVCSLQFNEIGDAGAVGLGEALKTNTVLEYIT
jgi:hypothetical protein